jgi:outer membrane protein TolC
VLFASPAAALTPAEIDSAAQTAASARAGPLLGLDEAMALARGDQPAIAAYESEAAASEQAAIAARSLPDPQVSVGAQNLPVTGEMAFNPTADFMTMYTIGIMREQVRRSRREAEAARLTAEAKVSRFEGSARQRKIQRDVMITWITAVEAMAKQRLLDRLIADLRVGLKVMEAGIPTGASTPALALQTQAEIAVAEAAQADAHGQEARARAELARWIGAAAQRPLPDTVPALGPPAETAAIPDLSAHPEVQVAEAQEQAAQRQVEVQRQERRPNLTWSVMYGFRPEFGNMVSATVSVPLQINRGQLQNRRIAEAAARADAARLRAEDARRELGGAYGTALADYRGADAQLAILRNRAIPSLEASFEAAEARYAANQGDLELPLLVVRRYVETTIEFVEQQGRRARAAAELIYLTGEPAR